MPDIETMMEADRLARIREARDAAKKLSRWARFSVRHLGVKLPLGEELRDLWTAPMMTYLFWCNFCEFYGKDHRNGSRRLYCPTCHAVYRIDVLKTEAVRLRDGIRILVRHLRER